MVQTRRDVQWHALPVQEVLQRLETSRRGLSSEEAARRRQRYGPNELRRERPVSRFEVLLRQFNSILIYILLAAAVIALFLGEVVDAIAIFLIVGLIGVVGFLQEWRAEEAIASLRRMLSLRARVRRDGAEQMMDSRELVPGDLVFLEVGSQVPADVRLVEATDLEVDESPLTGESTAVHKGTGAVAEDAELAERHSMAYMGTVVTRGWGRGVVVATGQATELGRIAQVTQALGREPTPLQQRLSVLGRQLGILALSAATLVAALGALTGRDLFEMLLVGISLAVAAIPEGLPAVVTLTLALGVRTMARRNALLRRMAAAEGLGAATVICTDKTGTLTKNEMTVTRVWAAGQAYQVTGAGYAPEGEILRDGQPVGASDPDLALLLTVGVICNHARLQRRDGRWDVVGDPTEGALLTLAGKAGVGAEDFEDLEPVGEISFDSTRKRMTILRRLEEGLVAYTKGAPEALLERCVAIGDGGHERSLEPEDVERVEQVVQELSSQGLRTLGFAYRRLRGEAAEMEHSAEAVERDMVFVGVVGMLDPPRPEVPRAIREARAAGIDVMMITGDAPLTARAIAGMVGLDGAQPVRGSELERLSDAELAERLRTSKVLARVSPEHKLRVVRVLRAQGHVVAVTGDGVNDAPALQQADIGVAMGLRGTDVAKGAADMVLTDDNFASIVSAVEEGRRQFDNIQKFVRYLLSANSAEVLSVLVVIALGYPLVLLPVQILWINLVSDSLPALALGVEPQERDVMRRPPRNPRAGILTWLAGAHILGVGGLLTVGVVGMFILTLAQGGSEQEARTVAFTAMVLISTVIILSFRSLRNPTTHLGFFSNPLAIWAVLGVNLLQVGVVYLPFFQLFLDTTPLRLEQWLLILGYALFMLAAAEVTKLVVYRRNVRSLER